MKLVIFGAGMIGREAVQYYRDIKELIVVAVAYKNQSPVGDVQLRRKRVSDICILFCR